MELGVSDLILLGELLGTALDFALGMMDTDGCSLNKLLGT